MKRKLLFGLALLVCGGGNLWAQTDVTSDYITNAGFDTESDFQSSNVATGNSNQRKDVTGWTHSGGDTYTTGAAIGFGTSGQINGASLPSTNSDGTSTGGALCLNAAWQSQAWYAQDVTLPAGNYTMTFKVNNVGQNASFEKDPVMFSFTTTDGASFSGNVHSYPVNTWTTQTITFALAAETQGTIKIGYKAANTGSGNTPKLIVDYVKAMYNSNYTATLQSTIDRATILNARANDSDLADAITTAQGVLDAADNTVAYQATIDNAVTTLRSAISTAAAKVILLEGENVTFMFENADFESGTPVTVGITTYDYDAATNGTHYSRMQVVEGWTIAENGNAKSAGIFEFGQNPFLGSTGTQYQAPASGSATGETKALGIVAVWQSSAQYKQACTLPAGSYILEIPVYNTAGTTAFAKNLIGFVEDGGTEHLATAKTYATGSWITEKVIFELENETSGYLSLGYTATNSGSGAMPHLFIDNVKVTYTSPIAAAYQKYQDALTAANAAIENTDYANVTGSEKTALQGAIDATPEATKEAYNAAADALDAAREAFIAAKANYDAFVAAKATVVPDLTYAAAAKKTTLEEAIAATATSSEDAGTKAAAITTALRAYYESNAKAEGVNDAVDYSSAVAAANADTNTGWTNGVGTNNGQGYTDSEGNVAAKYLDGGWNQTAAANVDMTRTVEIPAGKYLLTVKARGAVDLTEYTLSIAGETIDLPHANGGSNGVFGNGWDDVSVEFESDGKPQTLEVIAKSEANQQWFSMNDFRLVQLELNNDAYAGETEYTALNNAISAAEAKTLGFEDGQYAPYNNVAALEALAAAKAIDQTAELTNLKADVTAATEALTSATWTANDGDVDAIYNGTFAEANGNNPKGWTRSNNAWGQQQTGLSAETNAVNEGTTTAWYYNTNGAWVYGNDGVYTMPLAAEQLYKLTFKYRKHGTDNNNWMKASVLNSENKGLEAVQYPAAADGTKFQTVVAYFKTDAAGNYELQIEQNGNAHLTDVSLVKADAADLEIAAMPANYTYYQELTLARTFSADKWNTLCVPFAFDKNKFADVKVLSSVAETGEDVSMTFEDAGATVAADTPCLVKGNGSLTATNVVLDPAATDGSTTVKTADEKTTVTYQGTYAGTTLTAADSNAWVVSNNNLYNVTSDVNVGAFRAYFTVATTSGEVKSLSFDFGGETAIQGVEADGMSRAAIFNLAGQRVKNAQKGIYIVNGKKVLVK